MIRETQLDAESEILMPYGCSFDKLGYVPVASTISGVFRVLGGLKGLCEHSISAIMDAVSGDTNSAKRHAKDIGKEGAYHIARGIVEMVPFLGNALTVCYDMKRFERRQQYASVYGGVERSSTIGGRAWHEMSGDSRLHNANAQLTGLDEYALHGAIPRGVWARRNNDVG